VSNKQVSAVMAKIAVEDVEPLLEAAAGVGGRGGGGRGGSGGGSSQQHRPFVPFQDVLSTLLQGTSAAHARGQLQRYQVCATVVRLVDGGALAGTKEAAAAVQRLVPELDTLTVAEVARLVETVLAGLKTCAAATESTAAYDGACLSLLPKLLMRVAQGSFVDDDKVTVSGADFKGKLLEQLSHAEWPTEVSVRLVTVLREVPMHKKLVQDLTDKALSLLPSLPIQDLPAYVYQLLLFASTNQAKVRRSAVARQLWWAEPVWRWVVLRGERVSCRRPFCRFVSLSNSVLVSASVPLPCY
jgi:hypothetical protein